MIRRRRRVALVLVALGTLGPLDATDARADIEVRLRLPVRARIDLEGRRTLAALPFLVVGREGSETIERLRGTSIDLQREFERYLLKVLRRETPLKIVETGPIEYPTYDLELLAANADFWRMVGERAQADIIVAGSLDFDIQDKSGYRTEEYVSPFDGRTYYRQVLVEQTGYEYDIVLMVFDGLTGEQLYSDNFKDFKQFEGERADPLRGMFENLISLEDRILERLHSEDGRGDPGPDHRLTAKEAPCPVPRSPAGSPQSDVPSRSPPFRTRRSPPSTPRGSARTRSSTASSTG